MFSDPTVERYLPLIAEAAGPDYDTMLWSVGTVPNDGCWRSLPSDTYSRNGSKVPKSVIHGDWQPNPLSGADQTISYDRHGGAKQSFNP